MREKVIRGLSGWVLLFVLIAVLAFGIWRLVLAASAVAEGGGPVVWVIFWIFVLIVDAIGFGGLTVVNPNEAKVVTLFGVYKGSIKDAGFRWLNPLTSRRKLSLRVRNFESGR